MITTEYLYCMIMTILFVFLCIAAIASFYSAKTFGALAEEKGYDRKKYRRECFLLPILGALHVAALPDRRRQTEKNNHFQMSSADEKKIN